LSSLPIPLTSDEKLVKKNIFWYDKKMRYFITAVALLLVSTVFADESSPIKSPEQIQAELDQAEKQFHKAEEMFNPWYAGPLVTGGAKNMPKGSMVFFPYNSFIDNYAVWNSERKSISIPNRYVFNPQPGAFQTGITDWLDAILIFQGFGKWQKDKASGGFGDMTVGIGIPILKEGLHRPALRFVFNETFPTGRYQKLNPNLLGLDSSGGGSYVSQFGLRLSKLTFWSHKHPTNFRLAYSYSIPSEVHVRGFNSYGGGYGASGTVHPGHAQQADAAVEYSFTQKWVFACDLVYNWVEKTTFHGNPGVLKNGALSLVGNGSNDQLSLAPAIEYNPNANLNFVGGVWFDLYGRNSTRFITGILVVNYIFKL